MLHRMVGEPGQRVLTIGGGEAEQMLGQGWQGALSERPMHEPRDTRAEQPHSYLEGMPSSTSL